MHVVATAGHVDHGKSTLVRALTGMEPDRWAQERERGMTIDLGYAWTTLERGPTLAFVDVPGHQRFLGNMLAGIGPVPAVLFVVAADEGWRRQSAEHLAAIDALQLRHGLLAVTRADLADPRAALDEAVDELAGSSLGSVPAVAVSGRTGQGLDALRAALGALTSSLPPAPETGDVRLWVDRAFAVRGAGTVATGTLAGGALGVGDELELRGRPVRIRGLHSLGRPCDRAAAVARVAVNLRGVDLADLARGDALLTPGRWPAVEVLDVRLSAPSRDLSAELVLHAGTTAVAAHVRPLGEDTARLRLHRPLPLRAGDRALLRDPGRQRIAAGVLVLDADPPELRRRSAATRQAQALASRGGELDVRAEVGRRGAVRAADLQRLGASGPAPDGVREVGEWFVDDERWRSWTSALLAVVDRHVERAPLEGGPALDQARREAGVPDLALLGALAREAGLVSRGGRLQRPGQGAGLGAAEASVSALEQRLADAPFAAPEADDLAAAGLGPRELAAAERAGRLLRLAGGVVLRPDGPALAMRELAKLPGPFTLSQARQALDTTRRVAVPLLEHTDRRGWTRRVDASVREVVRG